MDIEKKLRDPTLVCTCSDLYINDIKDAIYQGEEDYVEIMQYNYTLPRCGECKDHIDSLVHQCNTE
ncbi:MAG: (2Fe-2S)-binding protein [Colwellia sp.]|nr:(2Fe-2S)-binding protein [Colwellia sp.]